MERLVFNDYKALAECMANAAEQGDTTYAVLFFEDAVGLMKELFRLHDVTVGGIDINQQDYDGYNKEYYISLDGEYQIDIEKAWHDTNEYCDEGYLWFDADKIYISGDASSAIIRNVDQNKCYEVDFGVDDEDETDEEAHEYNPEVEGILAVFPPLPLIFDSADNFLETLCSIFGECSR